MFSSERMKKVSILAIERDIDPLIMGLGTLREIHLTPPAKESEGRLLGPSDRREELQRLQVLASRVERLATVLHVDLHREEPGVPEHFAAPEEVAEFLQGLEPEIDGLFQSQQALSEEAADLRRIVEQVEAFEGTTLLPSRMGEYSFLHFALGTIPAEKLKPLQGALEEGVLLVPFRDMGDQKRVLAVTTKKGRWALETSLQSHGFKPEEVQELMPGLPDEVLSGARRRLSEIVAEDDGLTAQLARIAAVAAARLQQYDRQLAVRQKIVRAHENFGRTQSTYLVTGWVPATRVERFVIEVLRLTEHRAIIEIHDPDDLPAGDEPPTSLKHSLLMRPFALLVSAYGYPKYREIEPTIFVAISFFLMFGAMFGDVGQGGVLIVGGLAAWYWARKSVMKDFSMLVALCGLSGLLFGFVYGSFFGHLGVVPGLWGDPMEKARIPMLLTASLVAGVVIISAGVVLNIVNKFRSGDWAAALFDRFGLVGVAFYWGALGLGVMMLLSQPVNGALALVVLLVPLVLLFLKEPVRFALSRTGRKHAAAHAPGKEEGAHEGGVVGFLVAVVEGCVEVLEALLMYTANTASFMRLAAYALAHAGLCGVIYMLSEVTAKSGAGTLGSIALIVVGNVFVILLEGLVVAVQSMRLEYYEFFGKFMSGEGKAYKPFDLQSEES